jgi:hypothetical protein
LEVLTELTAEVRDVELPMSPLRVLPVEPYAYHAEFLSSPGSRALYQPSVLSRLLTGQDVPATTYVEARNELIRLRREIEDVFSKRVRTHPIPSPSLYATLRLSMLMGFRRYQCRAGSAPTGYLSGFRSADLD